MRPNFTGVKFGLEVSSVGNPADMATGADLELEYAMTYVVRTSHPVDPTAGSPWGARQDWQVSQATLDGPRIDARLAATGIDWMGVSDDGYWRPSWVTWAWCSRSTE